MSIRPKPRVTRINGRWQCWTPAAFGGRIVGWGNTPDEAFKQWRAM